MSRHPLLTAAGTGLALGAAALAYGALIERNRFTLRSYTVPMLPPDASAVRVLHLSDLHMAPWQHAKQQWVRELGILQPDLVVTTGDNLGHPDGLDGVRFALAPFDGVPGAFVFGSNDYHGPVLKNPLKYFDRNRTITVSAPNLPTDELRSTLTGYGWLDLDNAATAIDLGGIRFELFGVDDAHIGRDDLDALPAQLEAVREEVDDAVPTVAIGVAHAPYRRVLDAFVTNGANLILAGHTHGGQVKIPGQPALVTNCDIPRHKAQGLSTWSHAFKSSWLEVSAGLGTSITAPVRFGVPPEASLLTLVPTDAVA